MMDTLSNSYSRQLVKQQFLAKGVDHLHYIAPLATMYLIARMGILSYNKREEFERDPESRRRYEIMGSKPIADPDVQRKREGWQVYGKNLHDYVPLYIGVHTPMQYVVTQRDFELQAKTIAFAEVSVDKVFNIDGVCYTDGNAASSASSVYTGVEGIDAIDWHIVLNESRCWSAEYKFRKCAEVLVPDCVPPECIESYRFMTKEIADAFCTGVNVLIRAGVMKYTGFNIYYDNSHFYSQSYGKLIPNG
jgi:hypothetical protein